MKEIRFRAWDKKRKILRDVAEIDFRLETVIFYRSTNIPEERVSFDDIEIMQYDTSRNDKNGKEICEGDIVKADWHYDTPTVIKDLEQFFYDIHEYAVDEANLEVIGDVYQNPELLTKKEEVTC